MKYLRDVATIQIKQDACTGCKLCLDVCPRAVLAVEDKKCRVVDRDSCIECGACAKNCPFDAVTVDSGVGCAAAMINGLIRFGNPDKGSCDCSGSGDSGSSCC